MSADLVASPWPGALRLWRACEHGLDRLATPRGNPLRHLGAVAFLCVWVLAASGVVLYVFFDTSVAGANASLARLGAAGAALRALHRYAADVFALSMLAHLAREALHGRYASFRRYAWWTGLPLLVLGAVAAIGGVWLAWDRLAQYSATATAEWLSPLPGFAMPLTRNVLTDASITDRLFSLLVFVHLGVALLVVLAIWAHLQRLAHAEVHPPRPLALGTLAALLLLGALLPLPPSLPAALARAPQALAIDWWLLGLHPLMDATSPALLWGLVGVALSGLVALPLLRGAARADVACVDPAHCNGCRRCLDDCPYEAIAMAPHPLRARHEVAVVDAALCAGCGVCTGACPSSTPLRRGVSLVTGIDLPTRPVDAARAALRDGLARLRGPAHVALFGCDHGASVAAFAGPEVAALSLPCIGMLPPTFVDEALRHGAQAVVVAGCRDGGCEFRLGARWMRDRLEGAREPRLRAGVPRDRVTWVEADREEAGTLARALGPALTHARERAGRARVAPTETEA